MIISKTPLRISFAGGGSDLASFYTEETGCVLSTTIDKYIYVSVKEHFDRNAILLRYSHEEHVQNPNDIEHPILKQAILEHKLNGIEITSSADIPGGTGMGSSSSFTVGLLNALNEYCKRTSITLGQLAESACDIEINKLGEPIGKQDQYAAAFGGFNFISFHPDHSVSVDEVAIKDEVKKILLNNLFLVYTGNTHRSRDILTVQNEATKNNTSAKRSLRSLTQMARDLKVTLENGCTDDFGQYLHEGWMLKKTLSNGISNSRIETLYETGLSSGALGGKVLGSGGGGFILFYCPESKHDDFLWRFKSEKILPFSFTDSGSSIIYRGMQ
ncbi:hypothetical protein ACE1BS_24565 [Aeromonas jandaei]